ncbi:MAG: orotate phosphoribosyltransferase, partial [Nitrospirae bacterium]|nr:orotate phosphoribosyltransferase [Nitrospirota bacterium]
MERNLQELKKELLGLLYEKSFILSSDSIFVLSSGKKSNYYIDCKKTTLSPKGAYLIGNIV